MKLINDFISIEANSYTVMGFTTTIKFNWIHIIYTGHFPGHPVTPGVIQMQIVHELLEDHLGRKLKLLSMPQCKFVKILNPLEIPSIDVIIEFDQAGSLLKASAYGKNEIDIVFKLIATYQFIE